MRETQVEENRYRVFGIGNLFSGNRQLLGLLMLSVLPNTGYTYEPYSLPSNEWRMISLPCDPGSNNSPDALFGDDNLGTYGTDWIVYGFDATLGASGQYFDVGLNGNLSQGVGYWIIQTAAATKSLILPNSCQPTPVTRFAQCRSDVGCFEIPLSSKADGIQWNMIGSPLAADVSVGWVSAITGNSDCVGGCDLDNAESRKIVHNTLYSYSESGYDEVGANNKLIPWHGYWAATLNRASLAAPVRLLVPRYALNDTGITKCGDYAGLGWDKIHNNNLDCDSVDPQGDPVPSGQDAEFGRDAELADEGDGLAGFSYTKIGLSGEELPVSATEWSCVRDNVSGLIWELKTSNSGLHNVNDRYNWYDSNSETNGGYSGDPDPFGDICYGYNLNDAASFCNSEAYVKRVNAESYCGKRNWRVPSKKELRTLVNYSVYPGPILDPIFFPSQFSGEYLTSTTWASHNTNFWPVYFGRATEQYLQNGVKKAWKYGLILVSD